ncbi:MAG: hypothetical protein PUF97_04285 [Bifidobacteriaceae bacterium]|nr:hypothetical protein [Bifidobacteriaceae bacterium]
MHHMRWDRWALKSIAGIAAACVIVALAAVSAMLPVAGTNDAPVKTGRNIVDVFNGINVPKFSVVADKDLFDTVMNEAGYDVSDVSAPDGVVGITASKSATGSDGSGAHFVNFDSPQDAATSKASVEQLFALAGSGAAVNTKYSGGAEISTIQSGDTIVYMAAEGTAMVIGAYKGSADSLNSLLTQLGFVQEPKEIIARVVMALVVLALVVFVVVKLFQSIRAFFGRRSEAKSAGKKQRESSEGDDVEQFDSDRSYMPDNPQSDPAAARRRLAQQGLRPLGTVAPVDDATEFHPDPVLQAEAQHIADVRNEGRDDFRSRTTGIGVSVNAQTIAETQAVEQKRYEDQLKAEEEERRKHQRHGSLFDQPEQAPAAQNAPAPQPAGQPAAAPVTSPAMAPAPAPAAASPWQQPAVGTPAAANAPQDDAAQAMIAQLQMANPNFSAMRQGAQPQPAAQPAWGNEQPGTMPQSAMPQSAAPAENPRKVEQPQQTSHEQEPQQDDYYGNIASQPVMMQAHGAPASAAAQQADVQQPVAAPASEPAPKPAVMPQPAVMQMPAATEQPQTAMPRFASVPAKAPKGASMPKFATAAPQASANPAPGQAAVAAAPQPAPQDGAPTAQMPALHGANATSQVANPVPQAQTSARGESAHRASSVPGSAGGAAHDTATAQDLSDDTGVLPPYRSPAAAAQSRRPAQAAHTAVSQQVIANPHMSVPQGSRAVGAQAPHTAQRPVNPHMSVPSEPLRSPRPLAPQDRDLTPMERAQEAYRIEREHANFMPVADPEFAADLAETSVRPRHGYRDDSDRAGANPMQRRVMSSAVAQRHDPQAHQPAAPTYAAGAPERVPGVTPASHPNDVRLSGQSPRPLMGQEAPGSVRYAESAEPGGGEALHQPAEADPIVTSLDTTNTKQLFGTEPGQVFVPPALRNQYLDDAQDKHAATPASSKPSADAQAATDAAAGEGAADAAHDDGTEQDDVISSHGISKERRKELVEQAKKKSVSKNVFSMKGVYFPSKK